MLAMRMMQVTVHKVIGMVTVRNSFMTTADAMLVRLIVASTGVIRRAGRRVLLVHIDRMLVEMTIVGMVEMSVMDVVNMSAVDYANVPAVGPVDMLMVGVSGVLFCHSFSRVLLREYMPTMASLA